MINQQNLNLLKNSDFKLAVLEGDIIRCYRDFKIESKEEIKQIFDQRGERLSFISEAQELLEKAEKETKKQTDEFPKLRLELNSTKEKLEILEQSSTKNEHEALKIHNNQKAEIKALNEKIVKIEKPKFNKTPVLDKK